MTSLQCKLFTGGLLLFTAGMQSAFAISGCNNTYLQGSYNVQIGNANLLNTLNAVNNPAPAGMTAAIAPAGSTTDQPGDVPSMFPGSFLVSPYMGRYVFDGNGNVLGLRDYVTFNGNAEVTSTVGSYSVDTNCNATIRLLGGRTFDAVITAQGASAVFLETDDAGHGATGTLQRSADTCGVDGFARSFGLSYNGATPVTNPDGSVSFKSVASLGNLSLDGAGSFTLTSTVFQNGAIQRQSASGTYSFGADCGIRLSFAGKNGAGGATGAVTSNPAIAGLLSANSGVMLSVQAGPGTTLAGLAIGQ